MHFQRDTSLAGLIGYLDAQVCFFQDRVDREERQLGLSSITDRERAMLTRSLHGSRSNLTVWKAWLTEVQQLQADTATA
jgi:hypothetical protein